MDLVFHSVSKHQCKSRDEEKLIKLASGVFIAKQKAFSARLICEGGTSLAHKLPQLAKKSSPAEFYSDRDKVAMHNWRCVRRSLYTAW